MKIKIVKIPDSEYTDLYYSVQLFRGERRESGCGLICCCLGTSFTLTRACQCVRCVACELDTFVTLYGMNNKTCRLQLYTLSSGELHNVELIKSVTRTDYSHIMQKTMPVKV